MPDEHPEMEGRFRFSVGHEIGHWDLHRPYLVHRGGQTAIFDRRASQLVWEGIARERVTESMQDNPARTVNELIAAIFETFPLQ